MDELTRPDYLILDREKPHRRRNVLVLQGGGALGAYQAGVYQALAESGIELDWVAGVSIGAVNAAIIAGNPPQRRVERLREFWETITSNSAHWPDVPHEGWRAFDRQAAAAAAIMFGQPGFFRPRSAIDWMAQRPPLSFYDTSELGETLQRLVDFKNISRVGGTRLSVGAVNIETGNMIYFDSALQEVRPEHVMASGALPPGLAIVSIDSAHYWDGGLVSNTPLQYAMETNHATTCLSFRSIFSPPSANCRRIWMRLQNGKRTFAIRRVRAPARITRGCGTSFAAISIPS